MKNIIALLCIVAAFSSKKVSSQPSDWPKNPLIYEVNVRQHTEEGTLRGFAREVPKLRELGVNVIWFMPIQPIGMKKRKAKGDLFVEDITDTAMRKKYLGSPYSISNYTAVNPDYGTLSDFKNLVKACHAAGMKVILDWVGNHTAWDHAWITDHPDWYTKDKLGNITDPLNEQGISIGWTDVADLNYSNAEMTNEMVKSMRFWLDSTGIDGFRCDVAMSVPAEFWNKARKELEDGGKKIFMLAESEEHDMGQFKGAFNAYYGWELHHAMNEVAKGKKKALYLDTLLRKKLSTFPTNVYSMNFITNHDENSWNGTEFERMKSAWKAMAVFVFTTPGIPLLYTGQEYGNNIRLKFFEKDTIRPQSDYFDYFGFYKQLGQLRTQTPALGTSAELNTFQSFKSKNNNVLIFKRKLGSEQYWICLNLSEMCFKKAVKLPKGEILLGTTSRNLNAWDYKVIKLTN